MKICFFTENYYKGGLDSFLINLINSWPDAEDELILLCNSSHSGIDVIAEKANRKLQIKKYCRLFTTLITQGQGRAKWSQSFLARRFFILIFQILQYPILFPWYVLTLIFFFRSSGFDRLMVVNGGYPASLLCRSAVIAWGLSGKKPLAVMNFHSMATDAPRYNIFLENIIDTLVIRFASHVIGVSKACLTSLNKRNAFQSCTKLSYIYNGIEDPISFLKEDFYAAKPERVIQYCLMLATYHAYKGHFYLLEAFKNVLEDYPDLILQIYGDGSFNEKKQVADEVVRLGIENNVILGDFTPNTASLLAGASVLLMPSQAHESFGLAIVEAMAFGVPVVVTNVGGMPEILHESNAGFVCSKDDPMEFSYEIKKILGDSMLSSELGRNARLTFESRFMSIKMAQQYNRFLKNDKD